MKPYDFQTLTSGGVSYRFGNFIPVDGMRNRLTIKGQKEKIAAKYGLSPKDLEGPCRKPEITWPRFEAIAECRKVIIAGIPASLHRIGQAFGGRDHSTILASLSRYEAVMTFKALHGDDMSTVFITDFDLRDLFTRESAARRAA